MKYLLIIFSILFLTLYLTGSLLLSRYRLADVLYPSWIDRSITIDLYSKHQFLRQNKVFKSIHNAVFGNRDKYMYFPPRIKKTYTSRGKSAFSIHALVQSWDPAKRIVSVSTYINTTANVRFDPDAYTSTAYVPQLDPAGRVVKFGDFDIVSSSDNPKFDTLFCEGDIIELISISAAELQANESDLLLKPVEIQLRRRLCEQTDI